MTTIHDSLILVSSPLWVITSTVTFKISSQKHIKPSCFYLAVPKNITRRQQIKAIRTSFPAKIADDENGNHFLQVDIPDNNSSFTFSYQALVKIFPNSYDQNNLAVYSCQPRFLQEETGIETGSVEIQKLSQQITEKHPISIIKKAIALVHNTLTYKIQKQEHGAHYAATVGEGDCTEYACLLAAILRFQNIPARIVLGYLGNEELHAIVEVHLNGLWIPIDVTHTKEVFFGTAKNFITLMQGNWLQQGGKEQVATFYYKTSRNTSISMRSKTQIHKTNHAKFPTLLSFSIPIINKPRNIALSYHYRNKKVIIQNNENYVFQGSLLLASTSCVWRIIPIIIDAHKERTVYYYIEPMLENYEHILKWYLVDKYEQEITNVSFYNIL